jgi:hypothetical protein
MKLDQEIFEYLRGEKFSNTLTVELEREKYLPISREAAITGLVKDSNVIHIGCADHIPLIRDKIANNKWLHKLITENARSCIGIDIDKAGIDFLIGELGFTNVRYGNIVSDDFKEISDNQWDYAVFGEIIEHLDNPVEFLTAFREKYGSNVRRFIITVPNVYSRNNLKNMLSFKEVTNSDHRFCFTPYTINKLLVSAGYNPEKVIYANLMRLSNPELAVRKLKYFFHLPVKYPYYYFTSIIVTGTIY